MGCRQRHAVAGLPAVNADGCLDVWALNVEDDALALPRFRYGDIGGIDQMADEMLVRCEEERIFYRFGIAELLHLRVVEER